MTVLSRVFLIGVTISLQAGSLSAAPGDIDPSFVVGTGFTDPPGGNGAVNAVAVQPDGKILAGGTFTQYQGTNTLRITRLLANGDLDTAFVANQGTGLDSEVNDIIVLPDNKILIGGDFVTDNGTNVQGIARLNADGSLDATFPAGGDGVAGTTLRYIYSMMRQPDGKILVAGGFSSYNGVVRNSIARLHANGSLDSSFDAGTGPYTMSAYGSVDGMALQPDGKVVVCGSFTSWNGVDVPRVVRLDSTGSVDSSFAPDFEPVDRILDCLVLQDGRVLLAGGDAGQNLIMLKSDGSVDPSFTADADGVCGDLRELPNGKILIGGTFQHYDGSVRGSLARAQVSGAVDPGFVTTPHSLMNDYETFVDATAVQADGKILVAGLFTNFNGQAVNNLVRLDCDVLSGSGNLHFYRDDYSFDENAGGVSLTVIREGGSDGAVQASVSSSNLTAEAGLDYDALSQTLSWADGEIGPKVFSLNILDDVLDETNEQIALSLSVVSGLAVVSTGDEDAAVTIVDNDAPPVIIEDPANQDVYDGQSAEFLVSAASDAPLNYQWYFNDNPISGAVQSNYVVAAATTNDVGDYYVELSNGSGTIVTSAVATLTLLVSDGFPVTAGVGGDGYSSISVILPLADGRMVIGGNFTTAGPNGNDTAVTNLALLNANGTVDESFMPNPGYGVTVIKKDQNDGLLIAGSFSSISGGNHGPLVRFTSAGVLDTSFETNLGTSVKRSNGSAGIVQDMEVLSNGQILISGYFYEIDGHVSSALARLDADGSVDTNFVSGVDDLSAGNNIIVRPDGKILMVATTKVGGVASGIRLINENGGVDSSFSTTIQEVSGFGAVLLPDNKLLVTRPYDSSSSGFLDNLTRLNADGSVDNTFNATNAVDFPAYNIARQANGSIWVSDGYNGYHRLVKVNDDGTLDTSYDAGTGASGSIHQLQVGPDDSVWAFGSFASFDGEVVNNLMLVSKSAAEGGVSYADWAEDNGLTVGVNDDAEDDADLDGIKNILEFAFGSHPNQIASTSWPVNAVADVGGTNYLAVVFTRNTAASGVTIVVTGTDDLVSGSPIGTTEVSAVDLGGGVEEVTVRTTPSINSMTAAFLAVKVEYE